MAVLTSTPKDEERDANARRRHLERMQRASLQKRASEQNSRRAAIIREELARPRARNCRCGIRPSMTVDELRELGEGCTHAAAKCICPTLDAVRRRLGR